MKLKRNLFIAFFIGFLCIIHSYICAIDAIPSDIILFQDENLNVKTFLGISLKDNKDNSSYKSIQTSTGTLNKGNNLENKKIEVKLFDAFTVKEVSVSIIERTTVVPVGEVAGLKLYTNGVLVVGMSEIKGADNKRYKPYENSGIEEGDILIEINDKTITGTDNLISMINSLKGEEIKIKYLRNDEYNECFIKPIKTLGGDYKIGLWVRDSAAGIGTMTFYEPSSGEFAALGHGITDIDTGELIDIANGEFITTNVISIVKGKEGVPR